MAMVRRLRVAEKVPTHFICFKCTHNHWEIVSKSKRWSCPKCKTKYLLHPDPRGYGVHMIIIGGDYVHKENQYMVYKIIKGGKNGIF